MGIKRLGYFSSFTDPGSGWRDGFSMPTGQGRGPPWAKWVASGLQSGSHDFAMTDDTSAVVMVAVGLLLL
ncbi:hypothetical protein E2C01_020561 [Portunus trituberculatus]|uniref:Uncharacterized protein n=1 Tax=Portunus trituberculatus TaxID=210409 RepID=A0A5B7E039_PORTR|nr:hypothetical protein [Portunus trituberculatus]